MKTCSPLDGTIKIRSIGNTLGKQDLRNNTHGSKNKFDFILNINF